MAKRNRIVFFIQKAKLFKNYSAVVNELLIPWRNEVQNGFNYLCAVKKKKQIRILPQVLVQDYAAEGRSLARVDGKVIFIEGAVPGNVVDVQLGKSKKDWAEGKAIHFHSLSAARVQPFCSHFGLCGGCKWQMLPYAEQIQYKQREVEQNLKRIGGIELPQAETHCGCRCY